MLEEVMDNHKETKEKRFKKRFFLILIFIAMAIGILIWRMFCYESAEEKLAAIDAARAIPDSENAAIIYNRLLENSNESLLTFNFADSKIDMFTRDNPWKRTDYPELGKWLDERQDFIDELIKASTVEKCYFSLTDNLKTPFPYSQSQRTVIMRKWALLIDRSANNDIAENRIKQALEKYICLIHLGRHNRQQPIAIEFSVGMAIEGIGLHKINSVTLHDDITEEHLKIIEAVLPQINIDLKQEWENMLEIERLYSRVLPQVPNSSGLLDRLKEWWQNIANSDLAMKKVHESYLRFLADRQGSQILIGLRRYKNQTGNWPVNLDEIKPLVKEELLIDPRNNGPFVYKLSGDDFILYSKGPNNIDENGKKTGGADDWPIWPK